MNPVPQVADNADLLKPFHAGRAALLKQHGISEEQDIAAVNRIFSYPRINTRRGIKAVSDYIESLDCALGENCFPLFHRFGGGTYTREVHLPRGYLVVGKIHTQESMVYVLKGKILVADENETKIVEAPAQFVSKPWAKRVAYVIEDTIWIDIHGTDKTTVEDAENELFTDTYDETGYLQALDDMGYTEEEVRRISENEDDMVNMPAEYSDNVVFDESQIEGTGAFANLFIQKEQVIGVARVDGYRTPLGRYTNHSDIPNAIVEVTDSEILFVADENIYEGAEITVDYREARAAAIYLDNESTELCPQ